MTSFLIWASEDAIVSLALLGSLIESVLILPSHLNWKVPRSLQVVSSLGVILLVEKYYSDKQNTTSKVEYQYLKQ